MVVPEARYGAPERPQFLSYGISLLGLIVSNLAAVWFVFAYQLTLFQLVLVFWCECAWIGAFNGLKLLTASLIGDPFENRFANVSPGAALFLSLFVIAFATSLFFAFLGLILLSILLANEAFTLSSSADEAFNHIGLVIGVSLALMGGHALSFVVNFLLLGEFKAARMGPLVAQPFKRCAALFVSILASAGLIALLPQYASTAAFGTLVLIVKVAWDLRLHVAERHAFAPPVSEP